MHWVYAGGKAARCDGHGPKTGALSFALGADVSVPNLKAALRPEGRLVFVCWQPMQLNPLFQLALEAARPYLSLPPPSPPDVPGPFSLAPPGLAASLLEQAGFAEVCCQPFEEQISLGALAETAVFLLEMGPIVPLLAEVDKKTRQAVADRLCQLLSPHERDNLIFLGTCNWLVSARAWPALKFRRESRGRF